MAATIRVCTSQHTIEVPYMMGKTERVAVVTLILNHKDKLLILKDDNGTVLTLNAVERIQLPVKRNAIIEAMTHAVDFAGDLFKFQPIDI